MNISCVSATTPRNAKARPASRWSSRPALTGGRLDSIVVSRFCFRAISRSIAGVLFSGKDSRNATSLPAESTANNGIWLGAMLAWRRPKRNLSQAGRALQRLKAHKYFQYRVDQDGKLQFHRNEQLIQAEQQLDCLYLLYTSLEPAQGSKEGILSHYKNLKCIEDAFCQLKTSDAS